MKPERLQRFLLTATAVGMVLSSTLVTFDASGPGQSITPPGPFFAIWGFVIALCLAFAALTWLRPYPPLIDGVGWPLVAAQTGFSVWLFMARARLELGTVVVFVAILASLLVAMARLRRLPTGPGVRLAAVTVGLYAGWSSAAVWLNIITTAPTRIAESATVQVAGLICAGLTAAAVLLLLHPSVAYPAAVAWGLIGIAAAAFGHQAWLQLTVAAVCLLIVGVVVVFQWRAQLTER